MADTYNILSGQSFLDISLSVYGKDDYAYDIAIANGMSITDLPNPGTELFIPSLEPDLSIIRMYELRGTVPATGTNSFDEPLGIDEFIIEDNLIVM